MTYKDRTWCSKSSTCKTTECDRNLTQEEREKAIIWWGGEDFLITMRDFSDTCGKYVPTYETKEESEERIN